MQETPPPRGFLTAIDHDVEVLVMRTIAEATIGANLAASIINGLLHPYLRPLAELYLNDALPLHDAIILQARGLARFTPLDDTKPFTDGTPIHAVELTEAGLDALEKLRGKFADAFYVLEPEITSYAIRDVGHGLCLGPDHLRHVIRVKDIPILLNLFDPTMPNDPVWCRGDCLRRFTQHKRGPYLEPPDIDRAPTAHHWAPRGPARVKAHRALTARETGPYKWHIHAMAYVADLYRGKYRGQQLRPLRATVSELPDI